MSKNKFHILNIDSYQTYEWLLHKHYAKRIPSISYAFGLYDENNIMQGVITYGKPASPPLCHGVCGFENRDYVYELNRLCVNDGLPKNTLSFFVSKSLKALPPLIIVSYADTAQNHNGYIYQATNWIYTGLSDKRSEWRKKNSNSHSKSLCDKYTTEFMRKSDDFEMLERPRKHRYVYFIGSKKQKKYWRSCLKYKVCEYPKGENSRYDSSYNPTIQTRLF